MPITFRRAAGMLIGIPGRAKRRWTNQRLPSPPLKSGGDGLPQKRLSMRKIREVLRLDSLGLTQREIARSCAVGQSTVSEYLKAAEAAGLQWADVADWSQDRLEKALLPSQPAARERAQRPLPDFAAVHAELQQHKHLTLQLVWEEYRATHPEGYRYSRFCELHRIRTANPPGLRRARRPSGQE